MAQGYRRLSNVPGVQENLFVIFRVISFERCPDTGIADNHPTDLRQMTHDASGMGVMFAQAEFVKMRLMSPHARSFDA